MRIISIYFIIIFLFNSCKKKCVLKAIPKNNFDVELIKEESIILNCGESIDSLIFNDKYDSYIENSFKGLMNYRECGHHKSYSYNFRNESFQVCLDKYNEDTFELNLIGWFNISNDIKIIKENELLLNKEYIFEREINCDSSKSQIKRIILQGHLIKSIETIDNKIWIPI